ncbi:glycoside hydrolase family 113 [Aureisphaera sp.]
MKKNKLRGIALLLLITIGLVFFHFMASEKVAAGEETHIAADSLTPSERKHRGAHVFSNVDTTNAAMFTRMNIEWVTFVPWGFQDDVDSPAVTHHNKDSAHIQQHNAHWVRRIEDARKEGFKVFLKPHVWVDNPSNGQWRSDIFPNNDTDWEQWKATYRNFIIRYATVAEQAQAEMFCLGTEFTRLVLEKPEYWKQLIQEVRAVYSGKLTYAANWYEAYEKITFWQDLDYIGIQAYFPVAPSEYPSAQAIEKGWKPYLEAMQSLATANNRNILFTELGYKSTSDGAMTPWVWMDNPHHPDYRYSAETQVNAYHAFFNTVWDKEWFAGAHIWQMRSDYKPIQGKEHKGFTPQGKPAEEVIANGFE